MKYQSSANKNLVIEIGEQELAILTEALEKANPNMEMLSEMDQLLFAYHKELADKAG
ncbi:hypothetical protein ACFOGI_09435 [Virgibacillus xinjiangensis]|uniref:Uncharacterized protein n=1 Tax=Virgibacillus xinjiangensis TaxID=393090 RepID=A0ABV7CVI3_9BACI